MKKKDLKTGHLIELRSGEIAIVLLNTERGDVFSSGYCPDEGQRQTWGPLDHLTDDLKYDNGIEAIGRIPAGDVMMVYGLPKGGGNVNIAKISKFDREIIYQREE